MSFFRALGFFLAMSLLFSACKKPVLQDTALIPDDNVNLKFTDTLTVMAYTVAEDSVNVGDATLCAFGMMDDPDFGKTYASFYLPFVLKSNNVVFDDTTVTLDSIVLYLRYFSTYGEWRYPQSVEVYEMTESIIGAQGGEAFGNQYPVDYSSNKTFAVDSGMIGKVSNFVPNTNDSVNIEGVNVSVLKIKLDSNWGQKFIDSANSVGTSVYENSANFLQFFKGLYFTGSKDDVGKALVFFDPYFFNSVSVSRMTIYYHDVQDSSKHLDFPAAPLAVVNHYVHDYRNSTVENYISHNPTTIEDDSLVFIQGLAGVNTKVIVPHIRNLGNILINKAELVVTQINSGSDSIFTSPSILTLLESDAEGDFDGVTLDQIFPTSIFGGTRKSETDTTAGTTYARYRFSLSRYYQDISEGNPQYGIFILPDKRYQLPNRMIAGGGSHSKFRMKLNLTYTVIE